MKDHMVLIDLYDTENKIEDREILVDKIFDSFLDSYFEHAKIERPNSEYIKTYIASSLKNLFRRIIEKDEGTLNLLRLLPAERKDDFLNLLDSIFDYWRSYERYAYYDNASADPITHREFIQRFGNLSDSIRDFYRDIYEAILGHEQSVYRELPSGGNAGLLLNNKDVELPQALSFLNDVHVLEAVVTQPPFFIKSEENKRRGTFFYQERKVTPENFNTEHAFACIIKIYDTRALVCFDIDYLGFLTALGNLFQVEPYWTVGRKDVDFVVVFGAKDLGDKCYYYKEEGKYVGVCPVDAKIDYFGYAKKMVLTMFNLTMIERGLLPIHGAGVRIRKGEKSRNIVFLGDSGAGKSETLEAIKKIGGKDYQIDTIFDDMGTFHTVDGEVYTTGTEIGAFVRLDDLDQGYSLRSADRAIYMNIDEANSRVVIPIEDFEMTYTKHHVDAFFVCDNYTDTDIGMELFRSKEEAIPYFVEGRRVAMNTTSESGLVTTFFANPFGPLQKKEEVESFLPSYFDALFTHNVPVGKLYTRLSLDSKEGPISGAKALLDLFEKL